MPASDILSLVFALIAIAVVLYLCYVFSKFMANRVNNVSKTNNIKIVERVALAQDKGMVIVEVCGRYYLVGFANNNIQILKELDGADLKLSKPGLKQNFLDILNSTIKSRMDMKKSDKDYADASQAGNAQNDEEKEE